MQSISTFVISPNNTIHKEVPITAVIVPQVTTNLPLKSVQLDTKWKHLLGIPFADPDFGSPSKVDLLLGVDIFVSVLLNDWRVGLSGSPTVLETEFGWVLAGGVKTGCSTVDRQDHPQH